MKQTLNEVYSMFHRLGYEMVTLNEAAMQEDLVEAACARLNALANSVAKCNALQGKEKFPCRYQNFVVEETDGLVYIKYDVIYDEDETDRDSIQVTDYDYDNDDMYADPIFDKKAFNAEVKRVEKEMNLGIAYAQVHQQPVLPKKFQNKLDKLNAFIEATIQEYEDTDIILEEGEDIGFEARNFRIDDRGYLVYDSEGNVEDTGFQIPYSETLGIYELEDDIGGEQFMDDIRWYTNCIKYYIKYQKEYNPDWSEEEEEAWRDQAEMDDEDNY